MRERVLPWDGHGTVIGIVTIARDVVICLWSTNNVASAYLPSCIDVRDVGQCSEAGQNDRAKHRPHNA